MKPDRLVAPLDVIRSYRAHDFSLLDFLRSRVETRPDHEFLLFEDLRWSYADFAVEVGRVASVLHGMGVRADDRVGLISTNHPSTAAILFALASLGAVLVTTNPDFGVKEAKYVFDHAGVVGVIASPQTRGVAAQALAELGNGAWLILNENDSAASERALPDMVMALSAGDPAPAQGKADSVCLQIYTSGTTGFPKGVMHTQRSVVLTGEAFVGRMFLQPDERVLCVLPMFHINAIFYSLCGAIACGGTFITARRFSASTFWRTAADTGATEVNLVTAQARILIARPRSEFVPEHRIWRAFAAPVTAEIMQVFREEFGIAPLIECYGMTEIPGALSNPFLGPQKPGTMGIASPHPDPAIARPEFRIVDDQGRDVPQGQSGELAVRTPTIMQGYFRAPEQTAAAFRDGWFLTGDICRQDEDGFYIHGGRRHDIIRRRGENISGLEVDRVIESHPEVAEAATIAVPSELGEDDILVAIVKRPAARIGAEDVAAWVRQHLSAIKAPRYVAFVDSLPHTPTQRIEKYKLRGDKTLLAAATDLQR